MSATNHIPVLTVANLHSRYVEGMTAVQHISFTQQAGEKIAIAGETGSGKTTLLKMIAGLVQPQSGTILLQGRRVLGPDEQLIAGHRSIACLSQHFELRNNYWVHEILAYANELGKEKAQELYAICQVDHLLQRRTNQLSGGEKQRVALARLLSTAPQLLLLDEPFSNADMGHKTTIKTVLHNITAQLNISTILVSHDPADLLPWADKLLIMQDGTIIQQGTPQQVYYQPVSAYAAALLGLYNLVAVPGAAAGRRLFIRPEQWITGNETQYQFSGIVQRVDFCGVFDRLTVRIGNDSMLVNTPCGQYSAGSTIYLCLPPEHDWWWL